MDIVSVVLVLILVLCVVADTLMGLLRGRNRSLLRLGLVVISAIMSLLICKPITKLLMGIHFGEFTVNGAISEILSSSDILLPDSIYNLVFALAQVVLGVFTFVLVFLALKFLTWIIAFPILKIFVPCEEKKNRWLGALVGFAQGLFVAIAICGCLSGFLVEGNKITAVTLDGEKMIELPTEFGAQEYAQSPTAKFLDATGGWLFDMVSTTTDDLGRKVSITSICNTATTILNITNEITYAHSHLETLTDSMHSKDEQYADAMNNIGNSFVSVADSIEQLDEDSKILLTDLIEDTKDIVETTLGELPPELETMIDNIDINETKIKSAGEALNSMAKYVEGIHTNNGTEFSQEDADDIIYGIADNMDLFNMISTMDITLIDVDELNSDKFRKAIENTNLTQQEMDMLRNMFGLN